jgi:SOS response regulatory protein OraA/RecX
VAERRTVTALRAQGRGRVAVEVDGAPWRTLPLEPVLRAGLTAGGELDRERARRLRRELRRAEALDVAGRALRRRDLSEAELRDRLERRGVAPAPSEQALETLTRAGVVDDRRVAYERASALARREHGDAAIRWDLARRGVADAIAAEAVAALEPEADRARRIVRARGAGAATARYLARRGFAAESVEAGATAVADEP